MSLSLYYFFRSNLTIYNKQNLKQNINGVSKEIKTKGKNLKKMLGIKKCCKRMKTAFDRLTRRVDTGKERSRAFELC